MQNSNTDEISRVTRDIALANSLWQQAINALKKNKLKRHARLMQEALKVADRLRSWVDEEPSTELKERLRETTYGMLLSVMRSQAMCLQAEDRAQEAKAVLEQAMHLCEQSFGTEDERYFILLDELADAHFDLEENAEYEAICRQVIELRIRKYGRNHKSVAESLISLAQACREQGKNEEATVAEAEALSIQRGLYGEHHEEYKVTELSLRVEDLLRKGVALEDAIQSVSSRAPFAVPFTDDC